MADVVGTVPRFGESVITIPVTISAFRMARQAMGAMKGGGIDKIEYEMKGKLSSGLTATRFVTKGSFQFSGGVTPGTVARFPRYVTLKSERRNRYWRARLTTLSVFAETALSWSAPGLRCFPRIALDTRCAYTIRR